MATPTSFQVAAPTAEELARRLEDEVRRQTDATPEPTFRTPYVTQSYDYLCEVERTRFTSDEVDHLRKGIVEPTYWECEARHFKEQLSELLWHNVLQEYRVNTTPNIEGWRDVAMAYKRRLMRHGHSKQQVWETRLSIKDQSYWQPESECLREASALREHEMKERYRQEGNLQQTPVPARSEVQCLKRRTRRQRQTSLSQSKIGKPRPGKELLASYTSSKVRKRRSQSSALKRANRDTAH